MALDLLVDNIMYRLSAADVVVYLIKRTAGFAELHSDKANRVLERFPGAVVGIYKRGANRAHIYEDISYCLAHVKDRAEVYKERAK